MIIKEVLAALDEFQLSEILPPIAFEGFIHEDGLLVGIDELQGVVD
jgi:hypothetical protein